MKSKDYLTIKLKVNNHPGVMVHIAGLFSRRSYNLEAIWCWKSQQEEISDIYLLVKNDHALKQISKQLEKLYDVLSITVTHESSHRWLAMV